MEYYGYAGKVLYVNLTTGENHSEPLDMAMAKKFIGGYGLGEKLLYGLLKPGIDPLSPNNVIVIGAGPLVGTAVPGCSRIQMITKSACVTDGETARHPIGRSSAGSHRFGIMMKSAGLDQIVITGQAAAPVYLKIENDSVEFCPADELWEKKDIFETTDKLTSRHKGCGVIAIGRASERLTPTSLAFVDNHDTIGSDGGAAIMGSKNLKAITVRGTRGVRVKDIKRFMPWIDNAIEEIKKLPDFRASVERKWAESQNQAAKQPRPYPPEIWDKTISSLSSCSGCPMACGGVYAIKDGQFDGETLHKIRFGLVPNYGHQLELTDYRHAMKFIDTADRNGISLAAGVGMIMFLTGLFENGKITTRDTDGLELKTGDLSAYLELLQKMVDRDGIGDVMARGWFALSKRVGVEVNTEMADTGMRLHLTADEPTQSLEGIKAWCYDLPLSAQTVERIFNDAGFSRGRLTRHTEDIQSAISSLGICQTLVQAKLYDLKRLAEIYSIVTGMKIAPEELKTGGERIWNMGRLLDAREGFSRQDDMQMTRSADLEEILDEYYDERGWDVARGTPTRYKLDELGLP